MTITLKISDKTKEKMIEHFKDLRRDYTPPYTVFIADEEDTVVTLYESNKVVFQGKSADVDANFWKETEKILTGSFPIETNKKNKDKDEDSDKYYNINSIGSDEVGTGDYYGPIVVTASYVNKKDIAFLEELGVKDSKKLTDAKMISMAPKLIENIPHETFILSNVEYNDMQKNGFNMNAIKAVLHNRVLLRLLKQDYDYEEVIVDQFTPAKNYYNYLKNIDENVFKKITFTPRAEDKCLSVACSSIISRYVFLKEMNKLSKEIGFDLPLGAGDIVDEVGKNIVKKNGEKTLNNIAKINFKNTQKILDK